MTALDRFTDCKKRETHSKFILVKGFTKSNLPETYNDQDIADFVQALADLTVKISVSFTSPNRPDCWPGTEISYPFSGVWGSGTERVASGWVDRIRKYSGEEDSSCPCLKCRSSDTHSRVWGDVTVVTATHCVFDKFEAEKSTCRLFYDSEDGAAPPAVTIAGSGMSYADVEGDRSAFVCASCDAALLERLSRSLQRCVELKSTIARRYRPTKANEQKLTMIVSHPHGCSKRFSFGEWVRKEEAGDGRKRFVYNACTCPGSGGAPVAILGCMGAPSYIPHSGSLDNGINYSSISTV